MAEETHVRVLQWRWDELKRVLQEWSETNPLVLKQEAYRRVLAKMNGLEVAQRIPDFVVHGTRTDQLAQDAMDIIDQAVAEGKLPG